MPIIVVSLPNESEAEQFELSMLAMIALGVGEIVGSYLMGRFVDKLGPKNSSFVNMVLIFVASATVVYYVHRNYYGFLAYFMAFMWGLQDSSVSIHLNSILGFEFDGSSAPFSIDTLIEAIMVFCF